MDGASFRALLAFEEQASLPIDHGRIAVKTNTFVVRPLFFPGGDIGRLAVDATVNELAVGGAVPRWISAAFVVAEDFPAADLERIAQSMRRACLEAEVRIVGGDTEIVERGKTPGVFICTTGVGIAPLECELSSANARVGDKIIVSGPLGDHGAAVISARAHEGVELGPTLYSDVAPVTGLVRALLGSVPSVRWMRDPVRGGLARVISEISDASQCGVQLDEAALPFRAEVRAACERWGVDPLRMASAGRIVAVVPAAEANRALGVIRAHPLGRGAVIVGECVARSS